MGDESAFDISEADIYLFINWRASQFAAMGTVGRTLEKVLVQQVEKFCAGQHGQQRKYNEVLTLREVARILKCRPNQIYELSRRARAGTLHKTGCLSSPFTQKMKRVRRKDLMDWLDGLVEASRP
jgi:hypothetical protein